MISLLGKDRILTGLSLLEYLLDFLWLRPRSFHTFIMKTLEAALQKKCMGYASKYQEFYKSSQKTVDARDLWNLEKIFQYALKMDASLKRLPSRNVKKAIEGGIL